MEQKFNKETLCVQAGWTPKKGEPRVLPIYQSTTFKYDTSEQMARLFDLEDSGYFYTRLQNPTNDAVAAKIAALEGGVGAMLTSSGQAANFYAVFNICEAGDHFVCSSTIYGGTFNLFAVTMKKLGIECTFIDADAPEEEIEKRIPQELVSFTDNTITDREEVKKQILQARERGYAFDNMEVTYGIKCVGVPIVNQEGHVEAALSISTPSLRMSDDKIPEFVNVLKKYVSEIEKRL